MWRASRPAVRGGAMIVLIACVGIAAAQTGDRGRRNQGASAMDETTGSAGSAGAKRELVLSDEQRGRIYDSIMRISDAPVARAPAPSVADALPAGVPMHDLPTGLGRKIPLVQGHKFVKFDDRIVVVDPASRLVVAMIPRYKLLP